MSVGFDVRHKFLRNLLSSRIWVPFLAYDGTCRNSNIELETYLGPKGEVADAHVGYSIIVRVPLREGYKKGEEKSN